MSTTAIRGSARRGGWRLTRTATGAVTLLVLAAVAGRALTISAQAPAIVPARFVQAPPPALTATVNDFANVIDAADEAELDKVGCCDVVPHRDALADSRVVLADAVDPRPVDRRRFRAGVAAALEVPVLPVERRHRDFGDDRAGAPGEAPAAQQPSAPQSTTRATPQPQQAAAPEVAIAQRAAMLVQAAVNDQQNVETHVGTTVWRIEQSERAGVAADVLSDR